MQIYTHTLPSGAVLTGYLRDETTEMPAYNTRPAVLIIPGGGYERCSTRETDPVAMQFLQAGYHAFTLLYTVSPTPLRWQPLIDAAGAIMHLRRNAARLRVDPFKIAVCGFSAGGHLAGAAAILWDAEPVRSALGIRGEEARPDAVILGYPVVTSGPLGHKGSFDRLAGSDETLRAALSLETHVQEDLPPFFLWQTVDDATVPVQNTLLLAQALTEHHVPYELHLFPHGVHGSSICTKDVNTPNPHAAAWVGLCTSWLAEIFQYDL